MVCSARCGSGRLSRRSVARKQIGTPRPDCLEYRAQGFVEPVEIDDQFALFAAGVCPKDVHPGVAILKPDDIGPCNAAPAPDQIRRNAFAVDHQFVGRVPAPPQNKSKAERQQKEKTPRRRRLATTSRQRFWDRCICARMSRREGNSRTQSPSAPTLERSRARASNFGSNGRQGSRSQEPPNDEQPIRTIASCASSRNAADHTGKLFYIVRTVGFDAHRTTNRGRP